MFYTSSQTVLFSVPSLWVKSKQPIHPNMTPLSPDHLAASNRSFIIRVIRPTRMGPQVVKSCWQADLQPDQSPSILDLASLTLQAVNPTSTPFPQMDPKANQVTLELVPKCVWGGQGRVVLRPCFLSRDKWSGQPWSRVGTI